MPNAKDISLTKIPPLRVWVCGDTGTGKSIFASTFPTPGLVFDFDDGILSYRGKDFDYVQFDKGLGGWEKFLLFMKEMREIDKDTKKRRWDRYKTLVLDSTTSFTDMVMQHALAIGGPKVGPGNSPLWNVHYSIVKSLVEGNIRRMLDFKGNIVVIGHLSPPEKDDITGEIHIRPMLTGQLSTKLPGFFDEAYYSTAQVIKGEVVYRLQTVSFGYHKARSRISGTLRLLPDFVPNDYNSILEILKENIKKGDVQAKVIEAKVQNAEQINN